MKLLIRTQEPTVPDLELSTTATSSAPDLTKLVLPPIPPIWYLQSHEVRVRATSGGVHKETGLPMGAFLYETDDGGLVQRHLRDIIREPAVDAVMAALEPASPITLPGVTVRLRVGEDARYNTDWVKDSEGPVPDLMAALEARADALQNRQDKVENFAARVLGVNRSTRWNEAVSTALMGDWTRSLDEHGCLQPEVLGQLRAEVHTIHRQLVPLWRRRVRRSRLLLLDAPLGDGLCLYDLVADRADLSDARLGTAIHDDRLLRIVQHLTSEERLVVIALAAGDGATWTEAAAHAGASDAAAFGERVRRKTRRLAVRAEERRAAARATADSAIGWADPQAR
ncbi:hypothetical protein OG275_21235 [Streptomyces niveus]|uniref:hypothetical protein n=1 Tax=Streptomyces niveus TaxID=193462 RepID=UPI002E32F478|nr:hypothetical protein [Streptomyces niveus]